MRGLGWLRVRAAIVFSAAGLASILFASADLVYPASFEIVEAPPGQTTVSLTLPLIQGRLLNVRPVLPDAIRIEGEPETRSGVGSVMRVWRGPVDTESLPGSVFGLSGLLGTSSEVRFALSTLDGRRYEKTLKPTNAFFVVPQPRAFAELAGPSVRQGLRKAVRHPGLWFLLAALTLVGTRVRWLGAAVGTFALSLFAGHVLGAQSPGRGIPMAVSGLAAAAALVWVAAHTTEEKTGWRAAVPGRRSLSYMLFASVVLLTGLLAGMAGGLSVAEAGLSFSEARWATGLVLSGWLLGVGAVGGVLSLGCSLVREAARPRTARLAGLIAATWFLYQGVGLVQVFGPGWLVGAERLWLRVEHAWFAPFAADWAMAKLRVPWLTLVLLGAAAWVLAREGNVSGKAAVAGTACGLALVLLPWGTARVPIPLMSPRAPDGAQARRILEPMLSGIYHAVNLEGEGEAYDRLAEHVTGEMLTDLYVDSRRRLLTGIREGATVSVKAVTVAEVGTGREAAPADAGYIYPCRWTVTARVTHWSHTHERRNVYEGYLTLVVEDDAWKIGGIDLRVEEREVVPGSFSS